MNQRKRTCDKKAELDSSLITAKRLTVCLYTLPLPPLINFDKSPILELIEILYKTKFNQAGFSKTVKVRI